MSWRRRERHVIKGIAFNDLAMREPMKKGTCGTSIGLNSALSANLPMLAGSRAYRGKPATNIGRINLVSFRICNQKETERICRYDR